MKPKFEAGKKWSDWSREDLEALAEDYWKLIEFLSDNREDLPSSMLDNHLWDMIYKRYEP